MKKETFVAISFPLIVNQQLAGTCFIAGEDEKNFALVTTLHQIADGKNLEMAYLPHQGDISAQQVYPILHAPTIKLTLAIAEPLLDLAILLFPKENSRVPSPGFIQNANEIKIGEEVLVVGYPFSPIGSALETVQICYVSALGLRKMGSFGREEFILSAQTYVGSSGSPVLRRSDGKICGVVRGCLAPPGLLSIGNMPLGTDTNITYATSAHTIPNLLFEALNNG